MNPESKVYVSPSSSAQTKKHDEKTKKEAKGKSPVELSKGYRNLSEEFKDFSNNSINEVNAAALEDITYSDDEEDVATQTRNMTRVVKDQGGLTQTNNEDFHTCMFACFLSQEEPKRVHQALKDPRCIEVMQEELLQFKMKKEEGIDYEEVFAPVARIEAIRFFLAYASFMGFMVYQMDVKSAFLYETIEEEVYVCQPPGFEDFDSPDKVYKVVKALYGLHQAPRAWSMLLTSFLVLLIKTYVKLLKLMKDKFQISSMGKLTFFLGLQIKQKPDGIFISQDKYVAKILRKFGLTDGKSASTPIDTEKPLLKDPDGEDMDVHTYRSMIGSFMYLTSSRPDIMFASIDCLPNKEIFTELSRMGYEKSSTKLTFYKAFFSPQWKFLIHTILQCMSAKRTSWNEFSSSMASAVIYLSTSRKFNFSKYIFDSRMRNVDSSTKFYMVGNGFSGVETPLFEGMIVAQQADDVANEGALGVDVDDVPADAAKPSIPSPTLTTQPPPPSQELPFTSQVIPTPPPSPIAEPPQQQPSQPTHDAAISLDLLHTLMETCTTLTRKVEALEQDKVAKALEIIKLKQRVKKLERKNKLKVSRLRRLRKGEIISNIDADEDVILKDVAAVEKNAEIQENADVQGRLEESQAQIYKIDLEHADKVLSMQDDVLEPSKLKEVVEVVSTAKLITEVVTATSATITAATTSITTATITATPSAARRRKGVEIRDPEETATPSFIIHSEPKSKDKGKEIMVEEPKPLKKQAQIEQDEAYARELKAELNKNINWDDVIKNMVGFKMDYFKRMSYDDIRLIFEKYFNSNVAFLEKTKEQMEEEDNKALKRKTESFEEKAVKKQKLDEEVKELKKHLQIIPNKDDDVYTEATPLALKVPVVDYEIYTENNKPYFKIIRADRSHQLFLSFLSLLRNFDREDLEVLWQSIKERFASLKPKNFSDDFLLTTLTYMFKKLNVQAQVWKNQRSVHGLAKVKS
nr:hypothetical protein [Tanacetum cinerariifolium]